MESAKIILMGNLRVGKTSIIKSYMENSAGRGNPYVPTIAVQGYEKVVNVDKEDGSEAQLRLNIWDAAGDNAMHNLAHLYVHNVQVGIFVYSIDSKMTFD